MSGGHYNYLCFKVRDFTDEMETQGDRRRIKFKQLMELVTEACKAIEWEDSGDTGKEDTDAAIDDVFEFLEEEK